jgi:hypothetical protein
MPPADYDVIVIGGGVTGSGTARDCAMRGLRTFLVERGKPAMGTTVTSTHLIHGGLRYLLYDRLTTHTTCWDSGHIVRIARPLLRRLPILWPVYQGHSHGLETVETLLESYDGFQRMKLGLAHLRLSARQALALVPGLKPAGLQAGMPIPVVKLPPVGIAQDFVSLRDLLEPVFRRSVTGILVRVPLEGELPVGFLDLLRGGAAGDPKGLVVVDLWHGRCQLLHRLHPPALFSLRLARSVVSRRKGIK